MSNYTVRNRKSPDRRPFDTTIRIRQVCEATSPQKPPRGTIGYIYWDLSGTRAFGYIVMLGSRAGNTKLHSREQSTNAILAMGLEEKEMNQSKGYPGATEASCDSQDSGTASQANIGRRISERTR